MDQVLAGFQSALEGRYVLERELGRGGMATVHLAHDLKHDRFVALKVLHPDLAATLGPERFQREIHVAARLQHPHILTVLDSGEAAGQLWFTMPFVEGETLRARLRREQQLGMAETIRIAREAAQALQYAHEHGVIHRDVKPENILLTRDGNTLVADFGIAQALDAGDRLTETGLVVGTPAYMSPEQAAGERVLRATTDVYSLACVLYELLTGEPPYTGPSPQAIIAKRLIEPIPHLGTVRQVPSAVEAAVTKALAKAPADRFQTAAEFAAALETALVDVRAPDHKTTALAKQPWFRRWWLRFTLAGALLAALAAALWWVRDRSVGSPGAGKFSPPKSIAVLPFTSPDRDSANAYFGTGMAEELTTAFARVPGLRVASRGSASRFQDAGTTEAEIVRQLGVETILEGTVRRSGDRIRVTARLVKPKDGTVLWADQYDRRRADVFDVQDEMAQAIVRALGPRFVDTVQLAAARAVRGTGDLGAYDLYLKGRYYWGRRGETGLRAAIGFFERALARDSTFARAWAGLSMAQVVLPLFTSLPPDSLLELASQNAQRALQLDSTLADAHLALAYALKGQWRFSESERQFQQALALAPDDATIHHWYGVLLYVIGRIGKAVPQLSRAKQLDPLAAPIGTDLYYALYLARRYDEALTKGKREWTMDTTKADGSFQIGEIQLARGRPDSALVAFEAARRLGIGFDMRAFLSVAYRRLGRTRQADSLYAALLHQYQTDRSLAYAAAIAAIGAGDLDRAMTAVAQTIDRRSLFVTEISLPCDPLFDPLKQTPRFARMLGSVGMTVCLP
jgi:serine/threonine protein kinase/tetratricopeptide (TPR) repeat protein